jgi:hypothetical protein
MRDGLAEAGTGSEHDDGVRHQETLSVGGSSTVAGDSVRLAHASPASSANRPWPTSPAGA